MNAADARRLRWSALAASGCFLLLLPLGLPKQPSAIAVEPRIQRLHTRLPPVRLVRPAPRPPVPTHHARRVPVPAALVEPALEAPEPLERAVAELALPTADFAWGENLDAIPPAPPSRDGDGLMRVGGDVRPPVRISGATPQIPRLAQEARVTGVVILEAVIDTNGRVQSVEIVRGLPLGVESAVIDAVQTWRFKPATLNGRPVAVRYHLTINIHLR